MMGEPGPAPRPTEVAHPRRQLPGPTRPPTRTKYPGAVQPARMAASAHELILDCRGFQEDRRDRGRGTSGQERLMDFRGFPRARTNGRSRCLETLMVEPTESESKAELESVLRGHESRSRQEIAAVEAGQNRIAPNNPAQERARTRARRGVREPSGRSAVTRARQAAFSFPRPLACGSTSTGPPWRGVDNAYGEIANLVCTCPTDRGV